MSIDFLISSVGNALFSLAILTAVFYVVYIVQNRIFVIISAGSK